ncbi:MAG: AAA family ATPase [Desulfurivibrionaceae bacterium]|jgi:hypothetical protein
MYFKSLEIENVGPIDHIQIEFPKEGNRPKPVIIVGENGTGKSILLSHLVNSLIVGKQQVFEDSEVETGKTYKYRSPSYIKSGAKYSYSSVEFESGVKIQECQLSMIKSDFESTLGYTPARAIWSNIQENGTSAFTANFDIKKEETANFHENNCCLYFPVNRFEEPAWLNIHNLTSKTTYSELKHISKYSNRNIITISPLKDNKNWLLDLIFDRQAFEIQTKNIPLSTAPDQAPITLPFFAGYSGQSTRIFEAVLKILKVILRESGNIRLGAGTRKNRQISVMKDEQIWVPNLFQLSTGEIQLLNMFLSIVRDYDLSGGQISDISDIKGIVIIDEIDSHLHTSHQKEVLPELIASFPNIQFVITTHSPLFLMGMEDKLGEDNFIIINMPTGEQVSAVDFSEFNAAYEAFKETTRHREEIQIEIKRHSKPIVFVEGDYDIRYLIKAAKFLNKNDILEKVQLKDGDGFGNLDKIWKAYDNPISKVVPNKIVLLYDCDTKKQDTTKGLVYKRVIPSISDNPISIGIENLFPPETIQKIEDQCPWFIDTQAQSEMRIRGNITTIPAAKSVNKDEKGNLCNWLCENGTINDFTMFESVFRLIEDAITD